MIPATLPVDPVLIALVGILTQLLKPWLELAVPPSNSRHDPLIRSVAVLLSVALMLIDHGIPADGPAVIALLGYALGTAMAAIGGYHLIASRPQTPPAQQQTAAGAVPFAQPPAPSVVAAASPNTSSSDAAKPPA